MALVRPIAWETESPIFYEGGVGQGGGLDAVLQDGGQPSDDTITRRARYPSSILRNVGLGMTEVVDECGPGSRASRPIDSKGAYSVSCVQPPTRIC